MELVVKNIELLDREITRLAENWISAGSRSSTR